MGKARIKHIGTSGADVVLAYLHREIIGSASFHSSFLALLGHDMSNNRRLNSWHEMGYGTDGVSAGRNQIAMNICNAPTDKSDPKAVEWVFFCDDDMGFAPDSLDRLLASADPIERPIVSGLCFGNRWVEPDNMGGFRSMPFPTIFDWGTHPTGSKGFVGRQHFPVNSLIRCGATGMAFVLVHRSVFERVQTQYGASWFDRWPDNDGGLMGEDISFFARCGALDIPVYVNTGVRTTHMKYRWVQDLDFWAEHVANPATERTAVVVPVLSRPQNVKLLVESLRASTGLADAYFVCDPDDGPEIAEVTLHGGKVLLCEGSFARKANFAYRNTTEPWMFLCGDDVRFLPGWLDHAQEVAGLYNGSVIATNDMGNPAVLAGRHATHPLIRRSYVDDKGASWDGPGILCHEGYGHCFVDNEWTAKAWQDGVFQSALGARVEHRHPLWNGDVQEDEIYVKGQSTYEADGALFNSRVRTYMGE